MDANDVTRPPHAPPAFDPDNAPTIDTEATGAGSATGRPASHAGGVLAVGHRFGPRYQIIRLLGTGGMGAVYQAWDSELDVVVALKVIRPEATIEPAAAAALERRFKQELLLARQVTHKNVVRIHDLGEIDGIKYITMSYIQGENLAARLRAAVKLPVADALRIARQLAAGLVAAHDAGVVHRDLKPANIMIEGDTAIIMDFGIARSASGGRPEAPPGAISSDTMPRAAQSTTMAGTIVGTVKYMAPEQARGRPADQRADLYALGLIISDMLLGPRSARTNLSAFDELQLRIAAAPPPMRSIDPDIPGALERIVSRCLEPDPAVRFQTSAELVAELDRLDDNGEPLPVARRLTPRLMAVAGVFVAALLAATYVVTRRAVEVPVQPDPVSVVIADVDNRTADPSFDRVLEPLFRRALEGAGFISAFDRNGLARTVGVRLPERIDEAAAREIAVKQGLGVVLSGAIERQGNGYSLSVTASETVSGNVITTATARAASQDRVVDVAARLMADVRAALGDGQSESAQQFAMASLSTSSLDVVRLYAAAQDAASAARFEDARQTLLKAVQLDPKFGIGYQLLAVQSRNLGLLQDAEKYANEALRYLDGMTERERYSARGFYYRLSNDYQQCVKEYSELIARYAADVTGRNQLALCASYLRDLDRAVAEVRQVVNMLPNRTLFRINLALYNDYAGDFATAEQEARTVLEQGPDPFGLLALALAQLGQNQVPAATQTYEQLAATGTLGASLAASGLGDLAALQGRYADAAMILEQGAGRDLAAKNADRAAAKFIALAQAELSRGRAQAAIAAARRALAGSKAVKIRFLAARTFIQAGQAAAARPLIDGLAAELQAEPRAYAKIADAEVALANSDPRLAITLATEANALLDTWIGHVVLGRAYLDAGAFAQADSEFDRAIRRRGEALALFLDEEPTYAFLPQVYYYQGRVREGLKTAAFADSYRAYLAFRGESKEDPLLPEVRRRAGG